MEEKDIIEKLELLGIYEEDQLAEESIHYWWQLQYKEYKNNEEFLILINSIRDELEDYEIKDLIAVLNNASSHNDTNSKIQDTLSNESNQIEKKLLNIFKNAEEAEKLNNYEDAMSFYEDAINLRPTSIMYHFDRARCKLKLEDYEGAINDCTFEIELNDYKNGSKIISKAFAVRGICKFELEDYEDAIVDLNQRIITEPKDRNAYHFIGRCYYSLEEFENAIEYLSEAISLETNDISSYYYRGVCKMYLGDYQEAIIDVNKVVEFDENPENIIFRVLGICEFELNNYENASEKFLKAIEINDDDEFSKEKYMECLEILDN